MDEVIAVHANDFAEVRKFLTPEESHPDEFNMAVEYQGASGHNSSFFRARMTEDAKQRLPQITALKILEEDGKWKVVLYGEQEKTIAEFADEDMNALCAAYSIELPEHGLVKEAPAEEEGE